MLSIAPHIRKAASNPGSMKTQAPPKTGPTQTLTPVDQIDLAVSQQAEASARTSVNWMAAAAGAFALLAAAVPASAQIGPGLSLGVEDSVSLNLDSPVAEGQFKMMRYESEIGPLDNVRAKTIKQTYRQLVDLAERATEQFQDQVEELTEFRTQAEESPNGMFIEGAYVLVRQHGDESHTTVQEGQSIRTLIESEDSTTVLLSQGQSMTFYRSDGLFQEAGDFVMNVGGESLVLNQTRPTFLQRLPGATGQLETFEAPEYGITLYPDPDFSYQAIGPDSQMEVTVRIDGSTKVVADGVTTIEPGAELTIQPFPLIP